jgi:hypothetical protein
MAAAALAAAVAFVSGAASGSATGITGTIGTGKSRVLKEAAAAGAFPRLVVFDTCARRDRIEVELGNREIYPWPGEVIPWPEFQARARELLGRRTFQYVIDPGTTSSDRYLVDDQEVAGMSGRFARLAELCFHFGNVDLIGEESAHYARGSVAAINLVATASRHARVRLYLVSQRLMRIPVDARDNLQRLVVFALGGASDLKEIRAKCGPEYEAEARRLFKGGPPMLWELGELRGV